MSAYHADCPPLDPCGPCGTLPDGFVRLRYFFGKRMGVADFVDEQRYHGGKHRFHNQRLHGAGLLCGLAVTRMSPTDLLLRVGKGAAVDTCGREILVGHDQCIDLDAWLQRELVERREEDATWPQAALDPAGGLPLVVAIRFRDCPTGPEPAPRDTCSCDAAGCDFGRVRESFELELLPANDPKLSTTIAIAPPRTAVDKAMANAFGSSTITRALAAAATVGCADPDPDGWLRLATLTATLTTSGTDVHITGIGPIRTEATLLAQTALLQDLLTRVLSAQLDAGSLVDGPEVVGLVLETEAAPSTFVNLLLDLSGPLVGATVPTGAFTLTRFEPTGAGAGWSSIACTTTYVVPTATTPPRLRVHVDNGSNDLEDDGLYRLAIDPDQVPMSEPICDEQMRPLRPLRGAIQFGIDKPAADLVLVPAPYGR